MSRAFMALLVLVVAGCQTSTSTVPHVADVPHETFTLDSRVLGETRRINVYTPPGYASASARYPVLYMPDGGVEEDFPHVSKTIDTAIRAGQMQPVVLVGIENTERRRDMTGPTDVDEDKKIAPRVGGSASFRAFIRDELMPEIDKRVRSDGVTGIIGESLAGLFIVETFVLEPELFDVYVAISPSVWWNKAALVDEASARLRSGKIHDVTLYLTSAGDDILEPIEAFAAVVREQASATSTLRFQYEPMPGEKHGTIYRASSPFALRKVFPPKQ